MSLENLPNKIAPPLEDTLLGKGFNPESSMGFMSWSIVMNNISEIFSNPEFKKSIEDGKYNLLIVDDASARVPGLIFSKVINEIYTEKNLPNPKVLFVPGQRLSMDPNISEKISNHINKYLEKVNLPQTEVSALIITNTITSGKTLKILSDALTKSGIDCDITSTSLEVPSSIVEQTEKELENKIGRKIYTSKNDYTSFTGGTNVKSYSHGVTKNSGDMVSKKITGVQDHINTARKMVDKISEEIIEQIHSTQSTQTDLERYRKNSEMIMKYWEY